MARGHQLQPLVLSQAERDHLESLSRRRTSAQAIACRARIVLAAADGKYALGEQPAAGAYGVVADALEKDLFGLAASPLTGLVLFSDGRSCTRIGSSTFCN